MRPRVNPSVTHRLVSVSPRVIRYYEKIGLMRTALRSENGLSRLFVSRPPVSFYCAIARDLGFPIVEIGNLFSLSLWSDFQRSSAEVRSLAYYARSCQASKLQTTRVPLLYLADRCGSDDRSGCSIFDQLLAR